MEALKAASEEISAGLGRDIEKEQEFLDFRLPQPVKLEISSERAREIIKAHLKGYFYGDLPTVSVNEARLTFGPEPPGPTEAIERYLRKEGIERTPELTLDASESWVGIPVVMAAILILSWLFPLKVWSVVLFSLAISVLMSWALLPMRRSGFRKILNQSVTVASIGFFGIAVFALAYSVCALISDEAFGPVARLGYLFLFSTSLGIAGGVIGEPKGFARVLVHIQLLLFLSALITLIVRLLRIDRSVRRRG